MNSIRTVVPELPADMQGSLVGVYGYSDDEKRQENDRYLEKFPPITLLTKDGRPVTLWRRVPYPEVDQVAQTPGVMNAGQWNALPHRADQTPVARPQVVR